MNAIIYRNATVNDISFLAETIIEAEKSGTDKLPYSTIFGLTEIETKKYIEQMLLEEVDRCEISISSFLLAEMNNQVVGALGAWIKGSDGMPSTILKGNLMNFIFPKEAIERAASLNEIIHELHIRPIA